LGEIEAQLLRLALVKDAVVIAREDLPGEKRLVAYVVCTDSNDTRTSTTAESWRTCLKEVLPEYMVPSAFVILERLPLNANGKVDQRGLPAPELGAYATRQYEAPQGEVEEVLADIWQELLQLELVGREDNFFDLGGHSLLAMQVMARIRSAFSIEMPMNLLFEQPTLRTLAARLRERRELNLLDRVASGAEDIQELLEKVASMPDFAVEQLMRKLEMGGGS